jgi:hypothetical protein
MSHQIDDWFITQDDQTKIKSHQEAEDKEEIGSFSINGHQRNLRTFRKNDSNNDSIRVQYTYLYVLYFRLYVITVHRKWLFWNLNSKQAIRIGIPLPKEPNSFLYVQLYIMVT